MEIAPKFLFLILFCGRPVHSGKGYDDLIDKSDIFYINPDPNSKTPAVSIGSLRNYNSTNEIKLLVHGYGANKDHPSITPIRNAYLSIGVNSIFMADWSEASKVSYLESRFFVKPVGFRLAEKLSEFLKKNNLDPLNVHILGHSLGAHVAGNIGRYFKGSIGRITGLDPALPLFTELSKDNLRSDASKFTDVIHTDAEVFGDFNPRGHIDFYPNNGYVSQPGCFSLDILTFTSCSHFRAPIFYAESIIVKDHFPSVKCPLEVMRRKQGRICLSDPTNKKPVLMGEILSRDARGTYFLETNNVPPYGIGEYSKISK